jgi:hypothetical protein
MSVGHIYHYFLNKDAIIEALPVMGLGGNGGAGILGQPGSSSASPAATDLRSREPQTPKRKKL